MRGRSYGEWSVNSEEQKKDICPTSRPSAMKGLDRNHPLPKRLPSAEIRLSIGISSLAAV